MIPPLTHDNKTEGGKKKSYFKAIKSTSHAKGDNVCDSSWALENDFKSGTLEKVSFSSSMCPYRPAYKLNCA